MFSARIPPSAIKIFLNYTQSVHALVYVFQIDKKTVEDSKAEDKKKYLNIEFS